MLVFLRSVILSLLFFIFFVSFLILLFVRLELLDVSFWKNTFNNNVYSNLSLVLEKALGQEGSNIKIDNTILKPLFEENVANVLDFINGSRTKLVFSIPGRHLELQNQLWINVIKGKGPLISAVFILALILCLVFVLLCSKYAPGGVIISAIVVLLFIIYLIFIYKSSYQTFISGSEPSQLLIAYVGPAVFGQIVKTWTLISCFVLGLGIYFTIRYNHH